MNDLTGKINGSLGEPHAGLVGIVDCAINTVAKPKFLSEADRESASASLKSMANHFVNDCTVVIVSERRGNGLLEVETFSEDDGWHVNLTLVVTLTVGHLIIFHQGSVQSKSCSRILLGRPTII